MVDTSELDNLPVELFYRILDCLDIETIFRSLHCVCRRINHILGTYQRYKFNFESISKHDFHLICKLIPHDQVISLTLSDSNKTPGQIGLFLSSFNIKNFVRLSSLTLYKIDDSELRKLLQLTSLTSLKSLSIDVRTRCEMETVRLLQTFLVRHALDKLSLCSSSLCTVLTQDNTAEIKHLVLNGCMMSKIEQILMWSISLETLTLTDVRVNADEDLEEIQSPSKSSKLVYLSISSTFLTMDRMINFLGWLFHGSEQFRHLQVMYNGDDETYFDGYRWQSLLSTTSVTLFQFCFHTKLTMNQTIDEILMPFRSDFWLNEKCWFVACDKHRLIHQSFLYSIPWCDERFIWRPLSSFQSENTLTHNDGSIFNRVSHLQIKLPCSVLESHLLPYHQLSYVTSLEIKSMPMRYMLFTRKLTSSLQVILSQLLRLVLSAHIGPRALTIIFQQASSLRELTTREYPVLKLIQSINNQEMMSRIRSLSLHEELREQTDVTWLCETFPHVEILCVNVSTIRYMRTICTSLQFNLTNVQFLCSSIAGARIKPEKIQVSLLNWLHTQQYRFTFSVENALICIWLSGRQTKGWWDKKQNSSLPSKKRKSSLPSKTHKLKRLKSTNSCTKETDQDD